MIKQTQELNDFIQKINTESAKIDALLLQQQEEQKKQQEELKKQQEEKNKIKQQIDANNQEIIKLLDEFRTEVEQKKEEESKLLSEAKEKLETEQDPAKQKTIKLEISYIENRLKNINSLLRQKRQKIPDSGVPIKKISGEVD